MHRRGCTRKNRPSFLTHDTPTHRFSKALKFTLYTYQSISIGQSTLALALLDLKPIEIYLKIRIFRLDVWIIGVHAILIFYLLAALSVILPLFSSISLAIAFILGAPLAFDRAKFRSLLAAAVYLTDYLTALLTAWLHRWLLDCLTAWLPDCLSKYYYPILALRARTFALCDYTTTWEILWRETLYRAKTLVLLYNEKEKKIVLFAI